MHGVAQAWEKFSLEDINGGTLESGDRVFISAGNGQQALAQVQAQEQAAVLTSTQVQEQALAREQAQALSAYQRSLAYAELTRWTESWKEVERAYQRCRAYGIDPHA